MTRSHEPDLMNNDQWQAAWRILEAARALAPVEQRPFAEASTGDPEVLGRVLEMLESPPEEDPPEPPAAGVSHTGARIGRYEVGELLGRGGMGEVYAARDLELDRPVALKFLLPQEIGNPSAVKRFIREAKAASALNHPNILTVHEIIQSPSGLAIAMEMVEGAPLRKLRGAPLALGRAVELVRQVASALGAAHGAGIVHRDIKPENLMLRPDGFVKVLDFGLAYSVAAPAVSASTISRLPGGTLRYMSPEQLRGEIVGGASDVFSLGIVLYELISGRHPFESAHAWETAYAIHARTPALPSTANPVIPAWLDRLVLSMLAQDPAARPSAQDLAAQLARPVEAARVRVRFKWGRPAVAAAIVLALGAGVYGLRLKVAAPAAVQPRPPIPLTGMDGFERFPAFSPDGKQIVYSRDTGDAKSDLYLKLIGGGPPLRLPATESGNLDPAWSPDGLQIAFRRNYVDHVGVFVMGALGGAERLVGSVSEPVRAERGLTWRPDGKALIVTDQVRAGTSALWSLPLDGSAPQRLTSPPDDYFDLAPAFSRDGRMLAFIRIGGPEDLFLLEKPGRERRLTFRGNTDSFAWSADGNSIFFTTRDIHDRAIFRLRPGGGDPVRVSGAGASPFNITVAPRGDRLAFAQRMPGTSEILKFDLTGRQDPQKLIASAGFDTDPSFSPDGTRIVFASTRSGNSQIWVAGSDGGNPVPVTSYDASQSGSPRWSPDGKQIAFDHDGVFIVAAEGGTPRELTRNASLPAWSPDGRWIYFLSNRSRSFQLWRAPAAGGVPVQVTQNGGFECFPSPDGRFLYYTKDREGAGIWRMPADGGQETEIPELRPVHSLRYWSGTSDGIYFFDSGEGVRPAALKFFRFANRRVEHVLSPVPPPMGDFRGLAVSPDGRQVLWVQVSRRISQILLVEGFR